MKSCEALKGYGIYVDKVRSHRKRLPMEQAVEVAVNECISEGILVDFLQKNRAEIKNMSIFEYNQEEHMRQLEEAVREAAREQGLEEGRQQGLQQGLQQRMQQGMQQGIRQGIAQGKAACVFLDDG